MGVDIESEIKRIQQEADYNSTKYNYQSQSFASVYIITHMLTYVYYGLFIIFTAFVVWTKYLRGGGGVGGVGIQPRNIYKDLGAFVGFATFPFWVIYLEELIYRVISFVGSLVWGKIYINNFYKMFNTTDFYSSPKE